MDTYEQAVISYPEITKIKITNDIEFLVLACDGVWDCVEIQKFCEYLSMWIKKTKKSISKILSDAFDMMLSKNKNCKINFILFYLYFYLFFNL